MDIERTINDIKEYAELLDKYRELEIENKKLKESLDIATKCSSKEEDGIIRLSEENKKLKENGDYRYHRCMVAERKLTAFENEDLTEDL